MNIKTIRSVALALVLVLIASALAVGALALTSDSAETRAVSDVAADEELTLENASAVATAVAVFRCAEYVGRSIKAFDAVVSAIKNTPNDFKAICYAAIDAFTNKTTVVAPPSSGSGSDYSEKLYKEMISEIGKLDDKIGEISQDLEQIKASMSEIAGLITEEANKEYINDFSKDYVDLFNPLMNEYKELMDYLDAENEDIEEAKGNYDALYKVALEMESKLYEYMTAGYRIATDGKAIQDVVYDYVLATGASVADVNSYCIEFTDNLYSTYAFAQYCLLICRVYQIDYCDYYGVTQYVTAGDENPIPVKSIADYVAGMGKRYDAIAARFAKCIMERGNNAVAMVYIPASRPETYNITLAETKNRLYYGDTYYYRYTFPAKYEHVLANTPLTFETSDKNIAILTDENEIKLLDKKGFEINVKYKGNAVYTYSVDTTTTFLSGGYGTVSSPYLLGNTNDLMQARTLTNASTANFKLVSDITFTETQAFPCAVFDTYNATFDGNGYKISGFKITEHSGSTGFFGTLYASATVKDLTLQGSVEINPYSSSVNCIGVLTGTNNGRIYNCTVTGSGITTASSATSTSAPYRRYIGGIAGRNGGLIERCHSNSFTFRNSINKFNNAVSNGYYIICVGGLVGDASGSLKNNLVTNPIINVTHVTSNELCFADYNSPPSTTEGYYRSTFNVSMGYVIGTGNTTKDRAVYTGGILNCGSICAQVYTIKNDITRYCKNERTGVLLSSLTTQERDEYGISGSTLNRDVYEGLVVNIPSAGATVPYGGDVRFSGIKLMLKYKSTSLPAFYVPATSISGFDPYTLGKQTVTFTYLAGNFKTLTASAEVEVVCDHSWDSGNVTLAPTCTEDGETTYTCETCGSTKTAAVTAFTHDVEQHAAKAPTCTEKGHNAYEECKREGCDYSTYVESPAINHDEESHDAKAPTCTEIGWDAYVTCKRDGCGYSTYAEKSALEHDIAHVDEKAPTCTEAGWDAYEYCARPECNYTTYVEKPAAHKFEEWAQTTAPKCETSGEDRRDCRACDHFETRVVSQLEHDLENHSEKAPTCTEIGWDAYVTCRRDGCGYSTYTEKSALNHDEESHDAKAPTCTEIGWDAYVTCRRDGCEYSTYIEKSALNHDKQSYGAKDPTCTEVGWDAYESCSRCEYTTYVEKPITHTLGEWVQTLAPKCSTAGEKRRKCTNCDYFETSAIEELGHDEISNEPKAPTCTEPGWSAYVTCSRCTYSTQTQLPATGHTLGDWIETKSPTCEEQGIKRSNCQNCTYFKTEIIDARGHSEAIDKAKSPTCTATGLTAGKHCSICDEIIEAQTVIPALGHDETSHAGRSATCTEVGWNAYVTCSRCDYTTYSQIPEKGHSYGDWIQTTAPECESQGSERRNCQSCTYYETRKTDALGHTDSNADSLCDECKTSISAGGSSGDGDGLSSGALAGIIAGSTAGGTGIIAAIWYAIKNKWLKKLFGLFKK